MAPGEYLIAGWSLPRISPPWRFLPSRSPGNLLSTRVEACNSSVDVFWFFFIFLCFNQVCNWGRIYHHSQFYSVNENAFVSDNNNKIKRVQACSSNISSSCSTFGEDQHSGLLAGASPSGRGTAVPYLDLVMCAYPIIMVPVPSAPSVEPQDCSRLVILSRSITISIYPLLDDSVLDDLGFEVEWSE